MRRTLAREIAIAAILVILTTFLHGAWLIYPLLKYMTKNDARLVAILVALLLGAASALVCLRADICALAVFAGLMGAGVWLSFFPPMHDVALRVFSEFEIYLQLFWRELLSVTFAATIGNFAASRLLRKT